MRWAPLLAAVCGFLFWGCAAPRLEGDVYSMGTAPLAGDGRIGVGERYLDFSAPKLSGGEIKLSSLVGRHVLLLQFWGIRCAPCLAEFEFLSSLQKRYGDQGLQVIGINTDRLDADRLAEAMAARQINPSYPIVLDSDFSVSKRYTSWLIPVSVLISRQGIVEAHHTGYKPELESVIESEVIGLLRK